MCDVFRTVSALRSALSARRDLLLEILALRHQLGVLARSDRRFRPSDRLLWVCLRRLWPRWREALVLVQPATVARWYRGGFRGCLSRRSRRRPGRPRIDSQLRALIRRMATENRLWGAPRIHGELLKLGVTVSERTVSRYLQDQPRDHGSRPSWLAFLRNHREAIAAIDLFTVPTVSFRLLYVFFVISHARRQVLRADVTEHPNASWISQQLREAFPCGSAPKYLLLD